MLVAPPPPGSVPVVQVSVWFGTSLVHPVGSGDRIVTRLSYTSVPTPTPARAYAAGLPVLPKLRLNLGFYRFYHDRIPCASGATILA